VMHQGPIALSEIWGRVGRLGSDAWVASIFRMNLEPGLSLKWIMQEFNAGLTVAEA
jgi:hypothetical protein